MSRRRSKRDSLPVGRDAYRIQCPGGKVLETLGYLPLAVVRAQHFAMHEPDPIALTIERDSLFGPSVTLRRVERDKCGTVLTYTVAKED